MRPYREELFIFEHEINRGPFHRKAARYFRLRLSLLDPLPLAIVTVRKLEGEKTSEFGFRYHVLRIPVAAMHERVEYGISTAFAYRFGEELLRYELLLAIAFFFFGRMPAEDMPVAPQ